MKKFVSVLLIGLFLVFALSACTVAPAGGAAGNTSSVDEVQLYIIGTIASALLYGINWFSKAYPKVQINREWLSVLLYVVALILSVIWGGIVLPVFEAFSDPVTFVAAVFAWVTALLIALAPSVSFATLIYNLLLKRVLDNLASKG